jgi:hypothetical protein
MQRNCRWQNSAEDLYDDDLRIGEILSRRLQPRQCPLYRPRGKALWIRVRRASLLLALALALGAFAETFGSVLCFVMLVGSVIFPPTDVTFGENL